MQITAESNLGAVTQAAVRSQFSSVPGVTLHVTAEPRFALAEEFPDTPFGIRPTAPARWRNRHDHAPVGMDDQAKSARARGAAERIRDRTARQMHGGGGLADDHRAMVPRTTAVAWRLGVGATWHRVRPRVARSSPRPARQARRRVAARVQPIHRATPASAAMHLRWQPSLCWAWVRSPLRSSAARAGARRRPSRMIGRPCPTRHLGPRR